MASRTQTTNDQSVLVAGISAIMGVSLQLSPSVSKSVKEEKVSLLDYHDKTYSYGQVRETPTNRGTCTKKDSNPKVPQIEIYTKLPNVVERYAVKFSYNNDEYLIVLQNRVNPNTLIKLSGNQIGVGEYWVNPTD
ncbi:hypothetical protein I4U23_011228 [Adineta vaga]|nr:hypothetical protein I4U23_011228 [Adineta vaga]